MKWKCSTRTSKTAIRKALREIRKIDIEPIRIIAASETYLRQAIEDGKTEITHDNLDRILNTTASDILKSGLRATTGSSRARRQSIKKSWTKKKLRVGNNPNSAHELIRTLNGF